MRRLVKTATGVLGLVTLVTLAAPVSAQAGNKHHSRDHHRQGHHRHDHGHNSRPSFHQSFYGGSFAVPRYLGHHGYQSSYGRYHQQRVYHRGHDHHHSIYRFPVYTGHRRDYRSYAYCDGELYGRYRGGLHVSLGTPHFRVSYGRH